MVGLLVQEVESPFFLGVIRGVDQQVSATGYDFLLCTTHDRREKEAEYVARLSHGMVDGLMIILPRGLPDYVEQLRAETFPFVLIDYDADAPAATSSTPPTGTAPAPRCATCWTWATGASGSSPARSRPAPRRSASPATGRC